MHHRDTETAEVLPEGEPTPETRDPYFLAAVGIIVIVGTSVGLCLLYVSVIYSCFEGLPVFSFVNSVSLW